MTVVIRREAGERTTAPPPVSAADALRARERRDRGGLYKPRTPIYPKLVHGAWRRLKWGLLLATLGIYYTVPWLRWERPGPAPDQAVLVDLLGGRFYLFGLRFWPQEVYFVTGLLVLAALALFLSNALFGRLWCGYTCPQTVWTDLYIAVERAFEGDRNARMRLDAAPWSAAKVARKGGKHLAWLAIAFATGGAWVFYFHDAPRLWAGFWIGQAPITAYVSVGLLTFTTYWLAGHMREQVCTYLCPWPRIQGAMIDSHSLQVTYRRDRGEPRGAHKKHESWAGRGDCIDCNQCVVACPMGIDIRNGAQVECINCGLCIDACDEIMDRVERPRGLIGYDTDAAIAAREAGRKPVYRLVRSRTAAYAGACVVVVALMGAGLASRKPVSLEVLRDRNPTFVRLHDGAVRDGYTLKIANRSLEPRTFEIALTGLPRHALTSPGAPAGAGRLSAVVAPDQVRAVRVFVTAPAGVVSEPTRPVVFAVRSGADTAQARSVFLAGEPR